MTMLHDELRDPGCCGLATDYCIMLQSGRLFDLAHPEASEFNVEDIAHGLAHTCRYAGQAAGFYSVAEHSVLVSRVVSRARLAALFHDAAEAFIGDMSTPLKRLLPQYTTIEARIERVIFGHLGLEWPVPPEVRDADLRVMADELRVLMPPGTNEWLQGMGLEPAHVRITGLPPAKAKSLFLDRYRELRNTP
jgi:hypothetical protein